MGEDSEMSAFQEMLTLALLTHQSITITSIDFPPSVRIKQSFDPRKIVVSERALDTFLSHLREEYHCLAKSEVGLIIGVDGSLIPNQELTIWALKPNRMH